MELLSSICQQQLVASVQSLLQGRGEEAADVDLMVRKSSEAIEGQIEPNDKKLVQDLIKINAERK